jgi:predicted ATPase
MAQRISPKNIFVVGAQCTGKTTVVNALEKHFARPENRVSSLFHTRTPTIIREVARNVLKQDKSSPIRVLQLQKRILQAQFEAENAGSSSSSSNWYISDRSGIDPIAYARVFVGEEAAEELLASTVWGELDQRMKRGIVVLCEAGCSCLVDDGTRLIPMDVKDWMRIGIISREQLDISERVARVADALGEIMDCEYPSDEKTIPTFC